VTCVIPPQMVDLQLMAACKSKIIHEQVLIIRFYRALVPMLLLLQNTYLAQPLIRVVQF